jgi:hypothetical protein
VATLRTIRGYLADGPPSANQHSRETEKQPPTCDRRISQTTRSLETKFWGDDEHPKLKICPQKLWLELPTTPEIAKLMPLPQEHEELENDQNQWPSYGI